MNRWERRRGSVVGPLILIALGVVFLLNNMGYLSWDIWLVLWRLWPLLLVAIGLDLLIGRRSLLGSLIVVVLIIALFGGGLYLLTSPMLAGGQPSRTENIRQTLQGATSADVRVEPGAAALRIGSTQELSSPQPEDLLIVGTVGLRGGEQLSQDYSVSAGNGNYRLSTNEPAFVPLVPGPLNERWDLLLTPSVPINLRVNAGYGEVNLDLFALKLLSLRVSSGAGRTTVTLPARGMFQAQLSGGVGETVVRIPSGLAARIHTSTGIGSVEVPSGFQKQGDVYVSPDYDSASARVDLQVSGGIGRITIQTFQTQ